MILTVDAQLAGVARLVDASAVLVATWASGGVARIDAASPAALIEGTLPIPDAFLPAPEECVIHSPAPASWLTKAIAARAEIHGDTGVAVAATSLGICGTISSPEGGERSAMVIVWTPGVTIPAIISDRIDALTAIASGIVRGVLVARMDARTRSRLEALVEAVPEGIVLTDEDRGTAHVNAAASGLLGIPAGGVSAPALAEALRDLHARSSDPVRLTQEGNALFQQRDVVLRDWIWEIVAPDRRILSVSTFPVRAPTHRGRLWTFHDVTELATQRQALEEALARIERERDRLREAEERYRLATRATRDVVWDWELESDRLVWSDALYPTLGYDAKDVATGEAWKARLHADDRDRVVEALDRALRDGEETWSAEYRLQRADGSHAHVRDRGTVVRAADGRPVRMIGALQDESARVVLESQLRQAQKLEGIGRLAGGVAHDFNNLLTVIRGNLEFVRHAIPDTGGPADDLAEAQKAVDRASALTRQLLAFSRRQLLQPRAVDVHEIVAGVERLLRRVIGEDIHLETRLHATRCIVLADPGQLEQVLVNLAVNARDAMPDGGVLRVSTYSSLPADVDGDAIPLGAVPILAGSHVLVAVSDTGSGMEPTVLANAFEPFFTTKDVSKGSGLGLSIVHGIVAQSGGAVWLESTRGAGTTAWIALPVTDEDVRPNGEAPAAPAARRSSTILVVEDEASVRSLTTRILRGAGYRVVSASNGREALAAWSNGDGARVDAVVSDVVMPDMGGREFAVRLRETHPELPVLFVSGYTDGELAANALGGRAAFLEKPFSSAALLSALSSLLGDDRR